MTPTDLDALIEQFPEINPGNYGEDVAIALNNWGIDAVAALVQLREENARVTADRDLCRKNSHSWAEYGRQNEAQVKAQSERIHNQRTEIVRLEAEVARLTKLETECWSNPEAWMKWCDVRVLERVEDANKDRNAAVTQWTVEKLKCERAEAEVARLQDDTAEIDRLRGENARLLSDPMNVGWQRAQDAIKDRAAAVSQWKAAKQRIAALEAERDAALGAVRQQADALHELAKERDEQRNAADMIAEERDAYAITCDALRAHQREVEAERDALRDLLRRLRQWDMLSEGNTPRLADRDYWCEQIDAAIDAAKEKPNE